jgi:hypothetical protein
MTQSNIVQRYFERIAIRQPARKALMIVLNTADFLVMPTTLNGVLHHASDDQSRVPNDSKLQLGQEFHAAMASCAHVFRD